jgi:hypothetical protein
VTTLLVPATSIFPHSIIYSFLYRFNNHSSKERLLRIKQLVWPTVGIVVALTTSASGNAIATKTIDLICEAAVLLVIIQMNGLTGDTLVAAALTTMNLSVIVATMKMSLGLLLKWSVVE